jgi:hypothetical protein
VTPGRAKKIWITTTSSKQVDVRKDQLKKNVLRNENYHYSNEILNIKTRRKR